MTCSDCTDLVSEYLDGALHGTERSDFQTHLESCPECARTLQRVRVLRARLKALPKRQLPDAFSFRTKRMLVEEFDREYSWLGRLRAVLRPTPQTAWAAASGTVAAFASFALLWSVLIPSQADLTPLPPIAQTSSEAVATESQAVRYVLERLPSGGELIESTAIADTTRRLVHPSPLRGVQTVSADF